MNVGNPNNNVTRKKIVNMNVENSNNNVTGKKIVEKTITTAKTAIVINRKIKFKKRNKPRFWMRGYRNLKWWDNFIDGNMLSEEWKDNFFNVISIFPYSQH